jgi:flagellar basal-body rod protein FlgB
MLDRITGNLERYMDLLSARQKLVASNIANADTPGYKTQDVDFQFEFMTLTKAESPQVIDAQGLKRSPTAITSTSIGKRVCLRRMPCVSIWHPLWYAPS